MKWIVENWQQGWKWLSNWVFALITFIAIEPLPPAVLDPLPEELKVKIMGVLGVLGIISRFISQSKGGTYREY